MVKDGKFVYVGDEAGLSEYEGEVTDLGGKFIMPGIIDSHVHVTIPEGMDAEMFEAYKREAAAKKETESISDETDSFGAGKKDGSVSEGKGETDSGAEQLYLALGNDLNKQQLGMVLQLMDVSQEEYAGADVVYVTNEEEHAFLDPYIDPSRIGKNALSSVLVRPREEGYGIEVTTKNINFCTPECIRTPF